MGKVIEKTKTNTKTKTTKKMKKVMATGTFDILHPGHIAFLEEAKKLGDYLIVIVARDKNVKHKPKPIIPEKQRLKVVSSLKVVDEAVLGDETDIFKPVKEFKPDIIALGFDQHFDEDWLKNELKKRGLNCEIIRIEKRVECELCSSAKIIERVLKIAQQRLEQTKQF